jgi:broad-specificity NMP kinase
LRGIVVASFPGTGKTYVAERYSDVIDVDLGNYRFVYDGSEDVPFEARKAMKMYQVQPEWPKNYVDAVKEARDKFGLVLVTHCPEIEELMDYCYLPSLSGWDNLKKRLVGRGNNERYIGICRSKLESDLNKNGDARYETVMLGDDEYLEQALLDVGLLTEDKRRKK